MNMPATLHMYVPLYLYCSLHIDPTLLHTWLKINEIPHFTYYCKYGWGTNMPLKYHINAICQNYLMSINGGSIPIYIIYATYEHNGINHVIRSTVHRCWWKCQQWCWCKGWQDRMMMPQSDYICWVGHLAKISQQKGKVTYSAVIMLSLGISRMLICISLC